MYRVRRTRLDDQAPAAGAADAAERHILIDDRHITDTGAIALELVLNALPPTEGGSDRASGPQPKRDPGKAQG
ncbi:hypothetical protein R6L23_20060 [Streptomyces sp. SR27]|uniref:hypothetical protein n=1 Tax=Streptomyces sp. SR27 TaxID=3076630 RepID=UPI00295B1FA3|nr:hypothetical protein [Streptomyces sp. SR27]MDV9190483.1 hypothetical protein [Streptomyces sp. SR27]